MFNTHSSLFYFFLVCRQYICYSIYYREFTCFIFILFIYVFYTELVFRILGYQVQSFLCKSLREVPLMPVSLIILMLYLWLREKLPEITQLSPASEIICICPILSHLLSQCKQCLHYVSFYQLMYDCNSLVIP